MTTAEEFKQDVMVWARKLGVEPEGVDLCRMKKKWGKCSNKRVIFDISVLDEPFKVRLRIVVHELLHLRYPNHGKIFNRLLNLYLQEAERGDEK